MTLIKKINRVFFDEIIPSTCDHPATEMLRSNKNRGNIDNFEIRRFEYHRLCAPFFRFMQKRADSGRESAPI